GNAGAVGKRVAEGSDITLVGISYMLVECLAAQELLAEVGVSAEVIDPVSLLPLDMPCHMDAFGIITREGHLMSPGARQLLHEVRLVARDLY
ncbi:MAG: hypothetical protein IIA03_16435, partial [Proteobacteria bacterium]|nr:hypothetical protein [Pseudomonadota bacterium]